MPSFAKRRPLRSVNALNVSAKVVRCGASIVFIAASLSPTMIGNRLSKLQRVPARGGAQWSSFPEDGDQNPSPSRATSASNSNAKFEHRPRMYPSRMHLRASGRMNSTGDDFPAERRVFSDLAGRGSPLAPLGQSSGLLGRCRHRNTARPGTLDIVHDRVPQTASKGLRCQQPR